MNKQQKEALANALLREAGTLIEFWSDKTADSSDSETLATIDPDEAAHQLAVWLKRLPGDGWDLRLPEVWNK